MGEVADERVFRLVKELCASVPIFKQEVQEEEEEPSFEMAKEEALDGGTSLEMVKEEALDNDTSLEMDSSISYDKVLAELFDMGYDIELASRAIFDCGRLDVAAIIDHMNSEAPTSTAVAMDSLVVPARHNSSLPLSHMKVKLEEEQQHTSNGGIGSSYSRTSTFEASTSRAHSSVEDEDGLYEWDDDDLSKHSLTSSEPLGTVKGKFPMAAAAEDGDDAVDSDRWEYGDEDDDPGTDKESYLLRMGFCQKDVTDALEACGENSDVNHLANIIMNNIVDLPDSKWEDYDPVGDDLVEEEGPKKFKDDLRVWPSEELADRGVLILNKLQSIGFSNYSAKMVFEAIQARGKDAADDDIVDYVLATDERKLRGECEDIPLPLSKLEQLKDLGCISTAACLRAIDNNRDADIDELLDYIQAEEINDKLAEEDALDVHVRDLSAPAKRRKKSHSGKLLSPSNSIPSSQRKLLQKKERRGEYYTEDEEHDDDDCQQIRRNMKGFGLPGEPVIPRVLNEDIARPPYFYFENVALTPKDEWKNIQRHLYNIPPEFVDSLNFSPCRRPRGYVHNLPVQGRVNILPIPPMSIQELIPGSAEFWPKWDPRVKLNTINTRTASEFVRRQIQESMTAVERGDMSRKDIKTILFWARKWNLVWIRKDELAPLCPVEIERCLGFDPDHTRVLFSPVDRVRVLGNSFQVNTVAYHLSVLRPMYRSGIRVLSLFSGIGGAEVALHKLGIFLKLVVSVEIDDKARKVVDSWWKTTNQKGRLIHTLKDVKELDSKTVQRLVNEFGGFDLVIGGSPCNNLSGNNRCSRTGLAGPASVTFFEFPRILAEVRDYMGQKRR